MLVTHCSVYIWIFFAMREFLHILESNYLLTVATSSSASRSTAGHDMSDGKAGDIDR